MDLVLEKDGREEYLKQTDDLFNKHEQVKKVRNELVDNREDFKNMIRDVKTFEDGKKIVDMALAPDAKQLMSHLTTYNAREKRLNENLMEKNKKPEKDNEINMNLQEDNNFKIKHHEKDNFILK